MEGKVKFDNEPLKFATVYIVYGVGKDQYVACNVGQGGSYRVENVPVGKVNIKVLTYPPIPPGLAQPSGPNAPKNPPKIQPAAKIPEKYNDESKSGLTYEVRPGPQNHDILLQSR